MTDKRDWKLIQPCWGIFDIDGNWRPNPYLTIDAAEQRRQNVAAGYMTVDGKHTGNSAAASLRIKPPHTS